MMSFIYQRFADFFRATSENKFKFADIIFPLDKIRQLKLI